MTGDGVVSLQLWATGGLDPTYPSSLESRLEYSAYSSKKTTTKPSTNPTSTSGWVQRRGPVKQPKQDTVVCSRDPEQATANDVSKTLSLKP